MSDETPQAFLESVRTTAQPEKCTQDCCEHRGRGDDGLCWDCYGTGHTHLTDDEGTATE